MKKKEEKLLAETGNDSMDADIKSEIQNVLENEGFTQDVIDIVIGRFNSTVPKIVTTNAESWKICTRHGKKY